MNVKKEIKSEIDRREEFDLFIRASIIGLLIGMGGSALIDWIILQIPESNTSLTLFLIFIVCLIIILIIIYQTKKLMGVTESIGEIYSYDSNSKDIHKICVEFIEQYKKSKLNSDFSNYYEYKDSENKKFYDSKELLGFITISHQQNDSLDVYIIIARGTIKIERPTQSKNRSTEKYYEQLKKFILDLSKNTPSLIKNVKYEEEYIPED